LTLSVTALSTAVGAPKPITGATALTVQSWVESVKRHAPGRVDDPVIAVAALSYEAREELNTGMALFVAALLGRNYGTANNPAAKAIVGVGHSAGNPTANAFLKQAAVLRRSHPAPASRGRGVARRRADPLRSRMLPSRRRPRRGRSPEAIWASVPR
jgi:hypothetical protein